MISNQIQSIIKEWLNSYQFNNKISEIISSLSDFIIITILISLSYFIVRYIVIKAIRKIVLRSHTNWDDIMFKHKVFNKGLMLFPGILFYSLAPYTLNEFPNFLNSVMLFTQIFVAIISIMTMNAFINAIYQIYQSYEVSKSKPVKGYIQVFKIITFSIGVIVIFSMLLNKSPILLLGGLGAFSAVLLLIFKDPILGFVAGIQITMNDMVRPGDWIVMEKSKADGEVTDISLTTVKVQNWDKTISTIPTYSLVSESFINWRGMEESGGRRIKRSINIDMNSVKFLTNDQLVRFKRINLLKEYLLQKENELTTYNDTHKIDNDEPVNSRKQTNLGVFRIYVEEYLKRNSNIHSGMTCMVRQLQPTESGIPLEIYAFSKIQQWTQYESLQSDIFDHLLATIPEFELQVFQNPSGADFSKLSNR